MMEEEENDIIQIEGWVEKKKSQKFGQKSSTSLFLYKKKYFSFLSGGTVLAYYKEKRNILTQIEGFQFTDNFSLIISYYKDSQEKIGLVCGERLCVLKFPNNKVKCLWNEQIVMSQRLTRSVHLVELETKLKSNIKLREFQIEQAKKIKEDADGNIQVGTPTFYKTADITNLELVHRLQVMSECMV